MTCLPVKCSFCGKIFLRPINKINEALKEHRRPFCNIKCLGNFRNKQRVFKCGNPLCRKTFKRSLKEVPSSGICFCSKSCSAKINNIRSPKRRPKIKFCPNCKKEFTGGRKYCSQECWPKPEIISNFKIIREIRSFYKDNQRIPLKQEYHHYVAARNRFGTWNKAVEAAGFIPNPVLFAKKYVANDGHKCDSLTEKIIDDFLFARKIKHQTNVPYPGDSSFTADFVVGDFWIEFFGLNGELKSYDRLKRRKLKIAKKFNLKLIALYPKDLFPECKLDEDPAPRSAGMRFLLTRLPYPELSSGRRLSRAQLGIALQPL